ncbi:glycerophosphodiester phosphodiesterase family protein [Acidocella aminolytica]|jgi:glycerophosphoryl diester phosphodiesterase|uniref:Glycerophosphoryl diester phosphodiesterase n=1 Tax=Acidocella aminolytica 101 = DSM 11237 TaxID=1120923 RepID=A0A0D6PI38_9PROT|nr:glycerophosphodiester phosphodiesterase family protein [Acidocella aminolytica]GAN80868.1 glycerophosphoryl diester phosphodiesterase [Acidocella aminolytica 101 = DSM 11237]GBQ34232.1 hypothetical protein AA11237_0691 [Acidocella aminolytica 101 = DSM 11237]SHE31319.1 Glycerophosphoryl diester phosphodiesterase family protein [Acidocella aminolytica 101 = DSM 11237]
MIAAFEHRGARGRRPESTLPAFTFMQYLGLTSVEFDIAITAGGIVIVHHDPRLNPDAVRDSKGAYVGKNAPLIKNPT